MVVILFDLEGTLFKSPTNTENVALEFRVRIKKKFVDLGIPSSKLRASTKSTVMRNRVAEYVESHFNRKEMKRFHFELDRFLKSYELVWAKDSSPFPDTSQVLNQLRDLGHTLGLVTNTSREATGVMLSEYHLHELFNVIITREDVKKLKPDPEGILLALKRLNVTDFFFVGDLKYDSLATKRAGGTSIIVNRDDSNKRFHADYFVRSLSEIPSIIMHARAGATVVEEERKNQYTRKARRSGRRVERVRC